MPCGTPTRPSRRLSTTGSSRTRATLDPPWPSLSTLSFACVYPSCAASELTRRHAVLRLQRFDRRAPSRRRERDRRPPRRDSRRVQIRSFLSLLPRATPSNSSEHRLPTSPTLSSRAPSLSKSSAPRSRPSSPSSSPRPPLPKSSMTIRSARPSNPGSRPSRRRNCARSDIPLPSSPCRPCRR